MFKNIICGTQRKGGSGTTLMTLQLACLAAQKGDPVLFLQLSPQNDICKFLPVSAPALFSFLDLVPFWKAGEMTRDNIRSICQQAFQIDILPLTQARSGHELSLERTIHFPEILHDLREIYAFIFIDIPTFHPLATATFEQADAILYFSSIDPISMGLCSEYLTQMESTPVISKIFPVLNQVSAHTRLSLKREKRIFGKLCSDPEAIIHTLSQREPFVFQEKFPISKDLKKLFTDLSSFLLQK